MSFYDKYMELVKPFGGSERYHRWSCISIIAAALERKCWYQLGGLGRINPNMYILLVGGPGAGKTTCMNFALSIARDYNEKLGGEDGINFGPHKVTPASLIYRFSESKEEYADGFVQSAMYITSGEFQTFIKDIGGGAMGDDLLTLYDGEEDFIKETIKDGAIRVPKPCLNLLSATTPSFISTFMPRESAGMGLTARFIFATDMGYIEKPYKVPQKDMRLFNELVDDYARIHSIRGAFKDGADVDQFLEPLSKRVDRYAQSLYDGSYAAHYFARKMAHLKKVAMAISASRGSDRTITLADYREALELLDEAEPHMFKAFGLTNIERVPDSAYIVLNNIPEEPATIGKPLLIRKLTLSGLMPTEMDRFDKLLTALVESGLVSQTSDGYARKTLRIS